MRLFSILICFKGFVMIFVTIILSIMAVYTFHTKGLSVSSNLGMFFNFYLDVMNAAFCIKSKFLPSCSFVFSFLLWISFIIVGIFLFLRKSWARKMLLFLIITIFLNRFLIMLLIGRFPMSLMTIWDLVVYIMFFAFFTHKSIIQLFNKNA